MHLYTNYSEIRLSKHQSSQQTGIPFIKAPWFAGERFDADSATMQYMKNIAVLKISSDVFNDGAASIS